MPKTHTRRRVLHMVSATAAALGLTPTPHVLVANAGVQGLSPQSSQLLTADRMKSALMALASKAGKKNDDAIFGTRILPFTVALTVETDTIDTQFEYHEDRDHLFQILEGETTVEVDGTPQGGHSEQLGQWHAPTSHGTSVHTLRRGDMLLIPRGAPHRRSTAKSVTFMLISVTSPVPR